MAQKTGQRRRDLLLTLLAQGETQSEAARQAGYSRRTVHRWLTDPKFRDAVRHARDAMTESATGRLSATLDTAAKTLSDLLGNESPAIRLAAVRIAFDASIRFREVAEFQDRLQRLESHPNARHS